jgi:aspartate/methionine/tyrosine aminotransferase
MTVAAEKRLDLSRLSRRVASVSPSATLAIDAKAKAMKQQGIDVVGFGAGEPDFPTPEHIVEAAVAACRDPRNHRYTPTAGLPELRAAIAEKTARDSLLDVTPEQVLVTNGGKQAVAQAFDALCDPGDEVIVSAPYWTTYPEAIRLAGGEPVVIVTDETTNFFPTIEQVERAATGRTKILLFVSPSNPTGAVADRAYMEALGKLALERGWWIVTDEIYEHLVYGDARHYSMPVVVPELAGQCIVVNGVAKTYAMTGWRVGWMIGPPDVIEGAINLQSHLTSNVNNVAQRAALAALSGDLADVARMRQAFDRRRKLVVSLLDAIPGVECAEPRGAFYAFPSLKGVLGRTIRGTVAETTVDLSELVLDEARVAFVPGEAFGAPGYARFSYALSDEDISRGLERVAALFSESES